MKRKRRQPEPKADVGVALPEKKAHRKPVSEGEMLMVVTAEERLVIELLRLEEVDLDPESFNHSVLKAMLDVEKGNKLSPSKVEKLTGIPHQYHQKMHPKDPDEVEPHISLFTFLRWCGGLHVSALRFLLLVIKRLTQKRRLKQQQ